ACVHSLVVLLFHSYHLHRYLHSFPTRRSSDLGIESRSSWTTTDSLAFGMLRPFGNEFGGGGILGFVPELPGPRGRRRTVSTGSRSEEHTSELQSRFDLVCRLLLEKKKINHQLH